jgi:hypothetical protein
VRGMTGVFTEPIKGAEQEGGYGFVKGVAKGAVGVIVKPLVGVADAVSDGLQGSLLDLTSGQGVFAQRARPPRALGVSGELLTFSRADAEMQQQLAGICQAGGKRLRPLAEGRYIASRPIGGPGAYGTKRLILTTTHVISLHVGGAAASAAGSSSSSSGGGGGGGSRGDVATLEWYEPLSKIGTLEESSAELVLHLRDGGMRFVPLATSRNERRECFRVVSEALSMMQSTEPPPP